MASKDHIAKPSKEKRKIRQGFFANNSIAFFQPKLSIGPTDDIYEREADAVADQVMRMPEKKDQPFFSPQPIAIKPLVQTKCAACEEEEQLQRKAEELEEENVMLKSATTQFSGADDDKINNTTVQRQESPPESTTPDKKSEATSAPGINWFEMSRPFLARGAGNLLYDPSAYGSISQQWHYNYNLFNFLGLGSSLSKDASNFFTPFAIDSALKRDFPLPWEVMDRELNTSTIMIGPTLFNFDLGNLRKSFTMPSPFRGVFGLPENPYHPVQRKCAKCEEDENEKIQRKHSNRNGSQGFTSVESVLKTSGQPLDNNTRDFMEDRMGYDFSAVRIHNDAQAHRSSNEIGALAYTHKNHISFASGQYLPGSASGKKLLAHELTHVVQQRGASPTDSLQRQSAPVIDPACSQTNTPVSSIVAEALAWIDDIYKQLTGFEADQVFNSPGPDHARIASALQQTFHTTDYLYVQVIASRFYHIGRMLREPGRIKILCGGPGCTASGSGYVGAYVDMPYQIHLCGTGKDIGTFIHEMGHAVIPTVGVRNTVTRGGGIIDRAYEHERVFHHLTPEEALDNAESYGILAEALHSRKTGIVVTPQPDKTKNCSNPDPILSAFARAELWTRRAWQLVGKWVRLLKGQPISNLPQADYVFITSHLPSVTSTADLAALYNSLTNVYTSSYVSSLGVEFYCLAPSVAQCSDSTVGVAFNGKTTSSSASVGRQPHRSEVDFCQRWFNLSENDRIGTTFVLFLLARPSWMVSGINFSKVFELANFAHAVVNVTLPEPTTHDAAEHLFRDQPTVPLPVQPKREPSYWEVQKEELGMAHFREDNRIIQRTPDKVKVPTIDDPSTMSEWESPTGESFQWENPALLELSFPERANGLRSFLMVVKELELRGLLGSEAVSRKDLKSLLDAHLAKLNQLDVKALLANVNEVFEKYKNSDAFPKWIQEAVIGYSGMKYASAHGSYFSPQKLLSIIKTQEFKVISDDEKEMMIGEASALVNDEDAMSVLSPRAKKTRKDQLASASLDTLLKVIPKKESDSFTSLKAKDDVLWSKYLELQKKELGSPAFKDVQKEILDKENEIAGMESDFSRMTWANIKKKRAAKKDILVQIFKEVSLQKIAKLNNLQAVQILTEMHDNDLIPEEAWKEIMSHTDLRISIGSKDDLITDKRALKGVKPDPLISESDWKLWKSFLQQWYKDDSTGWREEHRKTLSPNIVTTLVCDQLGSVIQHNRGIKAPGGLRKNALAYLDAAITAKVQAGGTSAKVTTAFPKGPAEPFFKKPLTMNDFPVGASIFWATWSEASVTNEYMKIYTEEKSLKDKVKFEERRILEIDKKKNQTDTDKKNLQKHKDNIKKHQKRLEELLKEQEKIRIYTPDKDKTPDISNIISPMPGADRKLTVKGKEIKDCMTEDGWMYSVGNQRKVGKYQVESIMRAKRNPFFKSAKPLKCPDDFKEGQDETIVKQWLVWQHQATVMFVIPDQDKVITFDTSASLGSKSIKALGTQVRNLGDLVGNEMVFVGFMQER